MLQGFRELFQGPSVYDRDMGPGDVQSCTDTFLVPAFQVNECANLAFQFGKRAENSFEPVTFLDDILDCTIRCGIEDCSVSLCFLGQAFDLRTVLNLLKSLEVHATLHVFQGTPDPVAGERREFDASTGVE